MQTSPAFPFGYGLDYLDVSFLNSTATVTAAGLAVNAGEEEESTAAHEVRR